MAKRIFSEVKRAEHERMPWHIIYILKLSDGSLYTGYTSKFELRVRQHEKGEVVSTRNKRPVWLIYFEACLSKKDALAREKYLKSTYGKQRLRKRLRNWMRSLP